MGDNYCQTKMGYLNTIKIYFILDEKTYHNKFFDQILEKEFVLKQDRYGSGFKRNHEKTSRSRLLAERTLFDTAKGVKSTKLEKEPRKRVESNLTNTGTN